MRVFKVAAAAALLLALGTGCADDKSTPETSGAPATGAQPGISVAVPPSGKDPMCSPITALHTEYFDKVVTTLQQATEAGRKGDSATGVKLLGDADKLAKEWAGKLEPLPAQVKDPGLKTASQQFLGQLQQYGTGKADITQIQRDGPVLVTAIQKACS